MAKKTFKSGLDDFFKENIEDLEQNKEISKTEIPESINLEDISDDKLKWLLIKIKRYEKELHLWRTGKLNLETFLSSLKAQKLKYNEDTRQFEKNED